MASEGFGQVTSVAAGLAARPWFVYGPGSAPLGWGGLPHTW